MRITVYTQKTTRGHELRDSRDDSFIRLATVAEVAQSDKAAEIDDGAGLFQIDIDLTEDCDKAWREYQQYLRDGERAAEGH